MWNDLHCTAAKLQIGSVLINLTKTLLVHINGATEWTTRSLQFSSSAKKKNECHVVCVTQYLKIRLSVIIARRVLQKFAHALRPFCAVIHNEKWTGHHWNPFLSPFTAYSYYSLFNISLRVLRCTFALFAGWPFSPVYLFIYLFFPSYY